jgi:hypothetical protein
MRTCIASIGLAFGLALLPIFPAAQEPLPKAMAGTWTGTFIGKGGNPLSAGGTWTVVVEKQNPDGSIEGKVSWSGGRFCAMDNEPMTGRFDGSELTMKATFRNMMPNAGCTATTFVLKKGAGGKFEGGIPGASAQYRLTLAAP